MDKNLLQIIEYYGLEKQLEYFQSEVWELNEAIIREETKKEFDNTMLNKDHIAEEIADCLVMLNQIKLYFDYDDMKISDDIIFPDSNILKYSKEFSRKVYRFNKSIIDLEGNGSIKNNLLDLYYSLKQFQLYYEITNKELINIMKYKIERQLKRIENEKL